LRYRFLGFQANVSLDTDRLSIKTLNAADAVL
jgi:hypothetical protein